MHFHIIIPTYNRASLLRRAIDSVVQQKGTQYSIYVVDDGSTDNTNHVIQEEYNDIHYYYQENAGVSNARNFGIEKVLLKSSDIDCILFLDSDDELLPNSLVAIHNTVSVYKKMNYFAFGVINQLGKKMFYNESDNQVVDYLGSLSEKKIHGELFRVVRTKIFTECLFEFPQGLNGGEFSFRLEVNKRHDLLISDIIVRRYYQDNYSITRNVLNPETIINSMKVTKLFIDSYSKDLLIVNQSLLGIHYLVYARMLALSKNRYKSLHFGFKGLAYGGGFSRFLLYILSILPYGLWMNNYILRTKNNL